VPTKSSQPKRPMVEFKNYLGLKYITAHVRADRVSVEHGPVFSADRFKEIDKAIAVILITSPRPIRGQELKVIRKVTGMGIREFAAAIGVSHPTVMNWEKAKKRRLHRAEEAFVRVFFSEKLGVHLEAKLEVLAPQHAIQDPIEYTAA
jgi:DNA-binding transcriptional regulator YiaG